MFKNVASQKLTVIAFADAGHATLDAGEVVTGDAAQITLKVEQDDDGVRSASNDVSPTETEDGQYVFDLTQAETNGNKLTWYPQSSTAGVQVVGQPGNVIYTNPPNYQTLGIESDGDLTQVNTCVANTDMRGTDGVDTATMRGTDGVDTATMRGTDSAFLAASAPANFSSLGISVGGAIDDVVLVATTTTNTDMRGTDSAFLAASAPTNFSALGISVGGAIDDVTLVATTTTNTDMVGTDNAFLAASAPTNFSSLGISVGGAIDNVTLVATTTTNTDMITFSDIWSGTALTEAYAANGAAFTPAQGMFMLWSSLSEFAIASTTITAKKLDGSTTAMTFTLDDGTDPTSRTRAT